jgi:hypothetical protein
MGLGQERGNGHKDGELKAQLAETARTRGILNNTEPETLEHRK